MSRRSAPESTAELIPRILEEIGLSEASHGVVLLRVWDEVLGPTLAPHCRPEGLRRGVVQTRVRDSAWMQRLQMERPTVLERLREALGLPELELRMRIGPVE